MAVGQRRPERFPCFQPSRRPTRPQRPRPRAQRPTAPPRSRTARTRGRSRRGRRRRRGRPGARTRRSAPASTSASASPSRRASDVRSEPVAGPKHGHDVGRVFGIGLDLDAQVAHVRVDRPLGPFVLAAQHFEQVEAREHAARRGHERVQQGELGGRHLDLPASHVDAVHAGVEHDVATSEYAFGFAPAQNRLDARGDLVKAERLGDVGLNNVLKGYRQDSTSLEREILERQKAEQAAEAANRSKSMFLANMSHELRTPLNAILGFSQLMSRNIAFDSSQQENLGIINRSGKHLLELINDILDMSKIEAGKITHENGFNLDYLLDDLEAMFSLRAKSKGLSLEFERGDKVPQHIKADEKKLRQVLINLLGNAIKFTKVGGITLRVKVNTAELIPPTLRFEIEDTGEGIAPEEMAGLFDAFSQTQTGYSSQEGTGLGLAISYHFIKLMGGELRVSSLLKGKTNFTFAIPLNSIEDSESTIVTPYRRVIGLASDRPQYRILVVEDVESNRQLLTQLLQPIGFAVRSAENGVKAITLWQEWQPHLIWMDMRMPIMNGDEATRIIKASPNGQNTVIVALTASVFAEQKGTLLTAGCDGFVRKPFQEAIYLTQWLNI